MATQRAGDQLWVDGRPRRSPERLDFRRDARSSASVFGDRSLAISTLVAEDYDAEPPPRRCRIEARSADGQHRISFGCLSSTVGERAYAYSGLFFDLRKRPSDVATTVVSRRAGPVRLAIDGYRVCDELVEASLERIERRGRGRWKPSLLRLRLAPGRLPSPWLSTLCQRRPARRLTIELDDGCFALDELSTRRARLLTTDAGPLADPSASGPGLTLEFSLESWPPAQVEPRELDPRSDELAEGGPRVTLAEVDGWIDRALARAHDRFATRVAAALDRAPRDSNTALTVYADHLLANGDPRGHALASCLDGRARSDDDADVIALLGPEERRLRAACRASDYMTGDREWSPHVSGDWIGPFVLNLRIAPRWIHPVDEERRSRPVRPGSSVHVFIPTRLGLAGQPMPQRAWLTEPGFWALPELERMLALPCSALLSSRRVTLHGDW